MPMLWAQSLDNMSPDQIRDEDGQLTREAVIAAISDVAARGEKVFSAGGIELTVQDDLVVLEMVSNVRDDAGRLAPVICMGHFRRDNGDAVQRSLGRFAREIGRPASAQQEVLITSAFERLKKKRPPAKLVAVIIVVLVLLGVAFAYFHGSKRCLMLATSDLVTRCEKANP